MSKEALAKQERPQNCGTSYCSCIECVMDEQEQGEPVAWMHKRSGRLIGHKPYGSIDEWEPLCTTPQQRTWVGLTKEDADKIYKEASTFGEMMRMADAKLKEKNT